MKCRLIIILISISLMMVLNSFGEDKPFKEDVYEISGLLLNILSNYTTMNFDKITNYAEGKAKRDMEKLIFEFQNPVKYQQIKRDLSLLSSPAIKDVQIFENNLALAIVEWKVKRTVPQGDSNKEVVVTREINYLFKKINNQWKLISYR
ncbi:MAG: hypothetical protein ACP5PT_03060 [Brevinematia bacterium]